MEQEAPILLEQEAENQRQKSKKSKKKLDYVTFFRLHRNSITVWFRCRLPPAMATCTPLHTVTKLSP